MLKHACFWAMDRHRKGTVFLFYLSWHYHIYIFKSLCASEDNWFENRGETNVLSCKMFTSGCHPWLKIVTCLSSLYSSEDTLWPLHAVFLATSDGKVNKKEDGTLDVNYNPNSSNWVQNPGHVSHTIALSESEIWQRGCCIPKVQREYQNKWKFLPTWETFFKISLPIPFPERQNKNFSAALPVANNKYHNKMIP